MTAPTVERRTGWIADASTFGARLALVRQKMHWGNVKEAALACGLPPESWRTWERDGVEPRRIVTVAKQIASVTGCDYLWLLVGPDQGGGTEFKGRYNALGERTITKRSHVKSSAVQPTRRRAKPLRSPNRVESVAA